MDNLVTRITRLLPLPVDWGEHEDTIRRWEWIAGPVPDPALPEPTATGRARLNPRFTEWLMGWARGWVEVPGLSVSAQLTIIGNGVVPQQAEFAIRTLLASYDDA